MLMNSGYISRILPERLSSKEFGRRGLQLRAPEDTSKSFRARFLLLFHCHEEQRTWIPVLQLGVDSLSHALVQAPLWLCIHLPRYVEQAGKICKNRVCVRIDPGNITYVPVFCRDGTTVQWMPYRILAGITYAGRDTKCGHYRAFLSDAPLSTNTWFTDDGQPAKCCTDDLLHHIHHECYMCFLTRM